MPPASNHTQASNSTPTAWHNAVPAWITESNTFQALGATVRQALQVIANACDPPNPDGDLCSAYRGASAFAHDIGCSVRTFWRYVHNLEASGFVVLLGHGGPTGVRNCANAYGIPGRRGSLDDIAVNRTFQQMHVDPAGRKTPTGSAVYVPQVIRAGHSATMWHRNLLPPEKRTTRAADISQGVTICHDPSDKLSLPSCQFVTLPSHVPSPIPYKKTNGASTTRNDWNNGLKVVRDRKVWVGKLTNEDLSDDARLFAMYDRLSADGVVGNSEADRLRFVSAAVRALRVGHNPPALFRTIIVEGLWFMIAMSDETKANARIKRYFYGADKREQA